MFHVEKLNNGIWNKIMFTENKSRLYCDGYVDAYDSFYPSPPMRIMKVEKNGEEKIIRETKGRSKVTV